MSARTILVLHSAAILAVRDRSLRVGQTQIHSQQVLHQDAIAKLLAKSQSTIAAYAIL